MWCGLLLEFCRTSLWFEDRFDSDCLYKSVQVASGIRYGEIKYKNKENRKFFEGIDGADVNLWWYYVGHYGNAMIIQKKSFFFLNSTMCTIHPTRQAVHWHCLILQLVEKLTFMTEEFSSFVLHAIKSYSTLTSARKHHIVA